MKTLYITDLDGTLLSPEAELREKSRNVINRLLERGMNITCATARTASSALPILSGLNIELPLILMNGALLYDRAKARFEHIRYVPEAAAEKVFSYLDEVRAAAFVYAAEEDGLKNYAPSFAGARMQKFRAYRELHYKKVYREFDFYRELPGAQILYMTFVGSSEELLPVYEALRGTAELSLLFYKDVYSDDWFLELSREGVSKGEAALYLKEKIKADKLLVFGDNRNDIALFHAADFKIATANADPDILRLADVIIESNKKDSVAETLQRIYEASLHGKEELWV